VDHQHRHSQEQQEAEIVIREALERHLKIEADITFSVTPKEWKIRLDAYCETPLIFVEIWARQGKAKPAQQKKVMTDLCKLIWAEKLAGKKARKIFAVSCDESVSFLKGKSWHGEFAKAHEIEVVTLDISTDIIDRVLAAQNRQRWDNDLL
jgi:hypothetical protein